MKLPDIQALKNQHFENLENFVHKPVYDFMKRTADIVISLLALVIFLPFWVAIAVAIKIDSKGRAIFSHMRAGKDGKEFRLYKFRTMYEGVKDQEMAPQSPHDPRITRVGKFLRRTSLDEVPQLINILKGEMSFVGPRPEMPFIVRGYTSRERKRLLIKPGLTGMWQVLGRKDLPLHHNPEYDFYYIKNRSLLLDIRILVKTLGVVISGKGAY
jgi:lipopolysaccharide/colanic/teichoic acid biosynthesis glycosyltransferase